MVLKESFKLELDFDNEKVAVGKGQSKSWDNCSDKSLTFSNEGWGLPAAWIRGQYSLFPSPVVRCWCAKGMGRTILHFGTASVEPLGPPEGLFRAD